MCFSYSAQEILCIEEDIKELEDLFDKLDTLNLEPAAYLDEPTLGSFFQPLFDMCKELEVTCPCTTIEHFKQ